MVLVLIINNKIRRENRWGYDNDSVFDFYLLFVLVVVVVV